MSQVFKPLYEDVTTARKFGICDDRHLKRAYIDIENGSKWIATVDNNAGKSVTFTAFDNCIEFRTEDNKMESRCEGALTYGKTIILVEAKERKASKAKEWAKDAENQLKNTIKILAESVNLEAFENKRAAICNKLRTKSKEKHTERIGKFREDTGYILTVDNRIIIE